jgi:hypothetical protein
MAAAIFSLVSCLSWFYRSLSWNWFCHCVHWVHLTKNVYLTHQAYVWMQIRETGCNNCIMWAKADKIVQEFMYLSQDPGVRLLILSLTGCCSVEHMPYVYLTLVAGWMFGDSLWAT